MKPTFAWLLALGLVACDKDSAPPSDAGIRDAGTSDAMSPDAAGTDAALIDAAVDGATANGSDAAAPDAPSLPSALRHARGTFGGNEFEANAAFAFAHEGADATKRLYSIAIDVGPGPRRQLELAVAGLTPGPTRAGATSPAW